MKNKIQLNNGEWVTMEQYNQLRSVIDSITQKLNIKENGTKNVQSTNSI